MIKSNYLENDTFFKNKITKDKINLILIFINISKFDNKNMKLAEKNERAIQGSAKPVNQRLG